MKATVGHYKVIFCVPEWDIEEKEDNTMGVVYCDKLNELLYEVKRDLIGNHNHLLAVNYHLYDVSPHSNSHSNLEITVKPVAVHQSLDEENGYLKHKYPVDFNDTVKGKLEDMAGYQDYFYDKGAVWGREDPIQSVK